MSINSASDVFGFNTVKIETVLKGNLVTVLTNVSAWGEIRTMRYLTKNGLTYYLVVSNNGDFYKSDGQKYSVQLLIECDKKVMLHSCLCSWSLSELSKLTNDLLIFNLDKVTNTDEFNKVYDKYSKNYPHYVCEL